jgi:hypothetical protein
MLRFTIGESNIIRLKSDGDPHELWLVFIQTGLLKPHELLVKLN